MTAATRPHISHTTRTRIAQHYNGPSMAGARRDELERRTRHQPEAVEGRLFERWERECGFSGDPESDAETYVIALPPPNVTGELHMGHALNGSIQDTLMRLHRMRGRNTLWICGTDHASIAVHAVIEKQLRAEGTTRLDVGREAFVERVWEWRRETGATIIQQLKRLGCTLDYDHERFTMDEGYVRAVMEMFVRLYDKGLIYRDNRIVNWCPGCGSTVSDLEVRHERAADALYEVRYPITGTDQFLTVATVRPETILADTAVAVHPDDDRYRHLVGKTAIVPIVGREVPIIADEYVKMDFGTGALKVTPGHDPNDFEIGRRHGLPEISVIGFDGRMSAEAGEFAGLAVGEARQKVIDRLFSEQLLHGERPYEHEVGHCDRTGDRIEPLISLQWFMQMDSLAAAANAEVRSGSVRFVPKNQEAIYFHWMDNIRPWCISRQLWWGHQIPVWYCPDGHRTVSVEPPAACGECGSAELERDPDVLDTWFSSALWPFATLGWPEPNERLATFYPGQRAGHRPRHHQPVGGADADDGHRVHGREAVLGRLHHIDHPGRGRPPHVQVARHRHQPARPDRAVRRRRHPLRPAQDELDPGRALLRGHAGRGREAGQQALERGPVRAAADRPGGRSRPRWQRRPRTAGSCRGWRAPSTTWWGSSTPTTSPRP